VDTPAGTATALVTDWPAIRDKGVILEDDAVLVLNKPAGISVMGERHDTDVVRLAAEAGEELIPAHRIDKVTSGLVLFAKSTEVHGGLTRQFNQRTVTKEYLVVTPTGGLPATGTIDLPLAPGRKGRIRIAAQREDITVETDHVDTDHVETDSDETAGRWSVPEAKVRNDRTSFPSVTTFARLWETKRHTALLVRPLTGRRHQIRVHLAWIGHPIQGDPLFDKSPTTRTSLHAWRLAFDASWSDGHRIEVEADPGADLWAPIGRRWLPPGGGDELIELARQAATRLDAAADQTERGRTSPTS
jgi:tRNA pseudouridine32 synthase/23S rRNA pseudouridine746 synthase/23S rRNA pseudouridine1911/1915/1917 synthase